MSLWNDNDIDYSLSVTVTRPETTFTDDGDYAESFDTIIENMTADIQMSLKVRSLIKEDKSGVSDNREWIMFCNPPVDIQTGDRVSDGSRTFVVEAIGDWGSHTECMIKLI
ncbi:hypothetical protein ACFL30_00920 [Candidatus Latescibacterota bacterium]